MSFPSADSLEISKADMASIVRYTQALVDWVIAAQPCLEQSQ